MQRRILKLICKSIDAKDNPIAQYPHPAPRYVIIVHTIEHDVVRDFVDGGRHVDVAQVMLQVEYS